MTKLEELKAAYEAATPGEWAVKQQREYQVCNSRVICDKGYAVAQGYSSDSNHKTYKDLWAEAEGNTAFIALAHTLTPQLLEAVEALESCVMRLEWLDHPATGHSEKPWIEQGRKALEKLK